MTVLGAIAIVTAVHSTYLVVFLLNLKTNKTRLPGDYWMGGFLIDGTRKWSYRLVLLIAHFIFIWLLAMILYFVARHFA
jgi:hypothetical protein